MILTKPRNLVDCCSIFLVFIAGFNYGTALSGERVWVNVVIGTIQLGAGLLQWWSSNIMEATKKRIRETEKLLDLSEDYSVCEHHVTRNHCMSCAAKVLDIRSRRN